MRNVIIALIALTALVGAACSGGSDGSPTEDAPGEPSAVATAAKTVADVVAEAEGAEGATSESATSGDGSTATSAGGGSGEQVASQRPTQLRLETPERRRLVQAVESTEALESYEFEWSMTLPTIPDVPGGFSLSGAGAIDPVNERFSMTMDFTEMVAALSGGGGGSAEELELMQAFLGDDPMEIRYVDGVTYINWAIFGALLGAETPWIAFEDESTDNAFDSVSGIGGGTLASPQGAVAFLEDVWGIEEVGRETVRGVETTHYRGVIDFETMAGELSPEELATLESDLDGADLSDVFGDFPIDVWIDDDDVMRRFVMEMDFSGYGAAGASAEDIIGSMTMSYEFFNIGGAISVLAPPASEVSDVADSFLEGFALAG